MLDQLKVFFAENFNVRDVAFDKRCGGCGRLAPSLTSSGPTPAFSPARSFTRRATSMTRCSSPLAFVPVSSSHLCKCCCSIVPGQDETRKRRAMLLAKPVKRYFFRRNAPSNYGRYCGVIGVCRVGLNRHRSDQKRHQKSENGVDAVRAVSQMGITRRRQFCVNGLTLFLDES